jgi:hypothetical protein
LLSRAALQSQVLKYCESRDLPYDLRNDDHLSEFRPNWSLFVLFVLSEMFTLVEIGFEFIQYQAVLAASLRNTSAGPGSAPNCRSHSAVCRTIV